MQTRGMATPSMTPRVLTPYGGLKARNVTALLMSCHETTDLQ